MANLQANVLQIGQPEQLRDCFAMLTERSARILNLTDYGIAVGNPADIAVIDSPTPERAVSEIRHPVRRGSSAAAGPSPGTRRSCTRTEASPKGFPLVRI